MPLYIFMYVALGFHNIQMSPLKLLSGWKSVFEVVAECLLRLYLCISPSTHKNGKCILDNNFLLLSLSPFIYLFVFNTLINRVFQLWQDGDRTKFRYIFLVGMHYTGKKMFL